MIDIFKGNIILCGFMGSGKTTIGKLLSKKLDMDFIDTDEQIILKSNMSIEEIFRIYGEPYFRALEDEEVSSLMNTKFKVIATGGGTFVNKTNATKLSQTGKIIFLKADISTIKSRLEDDDTRPILKMQDENSFKELFSKRNKLYEDICDIIIDANNPKELICEDIIKSIG